MPITAVASPVDRRVVLTKKCFNDMFYVCYELFTGWSCFLVLSCADVATMKVMRPKQNPNINLFTRPG